MTDYMRIPPGTIYLGSDQWWEFRDGKLFCTICQEPVTNFYLAISHHLRTKHTDPTEQVERWEKIADELDTEQWELRDGNLFCTICQETVQKDYLAISHHFRTKHST